MMSLLAQPFPSPPHQPGVVVCAEGIILSCRHHSTMSQEGIRQWARTERVPGRVRVCSVVYIMFQPPRSCYFLDPAAPTHAAAGHSFLLNTA